MLPIRRRPRPRSSAWRPWNCSTDHATDDNAGATDDHRALNYLAMRYPGIYAKTAEEFARDFSLAGVDVLPSPLSGTRKMVDVVISYTNRFHREVLRAGGWD